MFELIKYTTYMIIPSYMYFNYQCALYTLVSKFVDFFYKKSLIYTIICINNYLRNSSRHALYVNISVNIQIINIC